MSFYPEPQWTLCCAFSYLEPWFLSILIKFNLWSYYSCFIQVSMIFINLLFQHWHIVYSLVWCLSHTTHLQFLWSCFSNPDFDFEKLKPGSVSRKYFDVSLDINNSLFPQGHLWSLDSSRGVQTSFWNCIMTLHHLTEHFLSLAKFWQNF